MNELRIFNLCYVEQVAFGWRRVFDAEDLEVAILSCRRTLVVVVVVVVVGHETVCVLRGHVEGFLFFLSHRPMDVSCIHEIVDQCHDRDPVGLGDDSDLGGQDCRVVECPHVHVDKGALVDFEILGHNIIRHSDHDRSQLVMVHVLVFGFIGVQEGVKYV